MQQCSLEDGSALGDPVPLDEQEAHVRRVALTAGGELLPVWASLVEAIDAQTLYELVYCARALRPTCRVATA